MERKSKSVAEKVADLILRRGSDDDDSDSSEEAPKISEFNEEYELPAQGSTDFRKRNVKLLSEQSARYRGKIASRKELNETYGTDSSEEEEEEEDEEALGTWAARFVVNKTDRNQTGEADSINSEESSGAEAEVSDDNQNKGDSNEDEEDDESDENDENQGNVDEDGSDENYNEKETEETPNLISTSNRDGEIQKGFCVQNQLRIWEKLLELRIQFQKLLNRTNELPQPDELRQQYNESTDLKAVSHECVTGTTRLLNSFLNLQDALRNQFSELKNSRKRTRMNLNDDEIPTKRFSKYLEEGFSDFREYRNALLLKWDDRTKLLTPGAGAKKKSLNEEFDVIKKIDNALLNRNVMVQRSQVPKSGDNPVDPQNSAEVNNPRLEQIRNVNIFDDSDFYHQQLRELIEYKANTSTSLSEITRQYVELQKLRQKMKKKVDTRASKGRKIRYVVHNKLINFMAPLDTSNWTDESKNELYKSLFTT